MRITVEETSWKDGTATRLRAEQEREVVLRYGADLEAGAKPSASDVAVFLLATDMDSGDVVGCGGLRRLDPYTYEIKRMYVVPHWRGRRIGRVLLRQLEEAARERGATRVRLETGTEQPESRTLYERCGYRRIERFGPYVDCEASICYERLLPGGEEAETTGPAL
ncbi:GNAT superfamily N-acetyltransferase [Lipingzhangella halophila]|uniref:GNAT superfamily N-acetyltransferase n=1 Tax=Lipingzhangella halophila TaxID=1783352 RepID=A0A7W7RHY2_9ACTN|nr:GNAT family N-acetyltransferase [Lipingzhangella halophila]MBB4931913.1 GNAT superfamily N-acetyltransferase [Lipingzhangella halophila]